MPAALRRGQLRTLSYATFANTVGSGLWAAGVALFLTRYAQLPVATVGAGLTVAGLVGLAASVPFGHLADRRDPRTLRAAIQVAQAAVATAYLLVDSFGTLLVVAIADAVLVAGNLAVRAALIAAVAGPAHRVRAFATLRAVANAGISIGAVLAGFALAADTRTGYALLVAGNAVTYLLSAGLLLRLPAYPPNVAVPAANVAVPRANVAVPAPSVAVPAPSVAVPRAGRAVSRALRDRPFLAVSAACAVLSAHHVVLVLIVPLWIAERTGAPRWVVSLVLVTNTLLTVLLAVAISRRTTSAGSAARAVRHAAVFLAVAMLLYATSAGRSATLTVAVLLGATVVYTVGDLLHSTGAAGLSYDLAPPAALGQYQGASLMVTGLAEAVAPAALTLLLLGGGGPVHWALLAAVFLGAGLAVPGLTRRALRRPELTAPPGGRTS